MKRDRHTKRGLMRHPRAKLTTGLIAGLTLLAGVVTFAQVSSAEDAPGATPEPASFPALAAASRIPNDQGPPKECTPAPKPPATTAPTAPATTAPTAPATEDPAEPTVPAPDPADPNATGTDPAAPDPAAPDPAAPDPAAPDPAAPDPAAPDPAAPDPAAADPADANPPDAATPADEKALVESLHHRGGRPSEACHADLGGPVASDYIDIRRVPVNARSPRPGRNGSAGTFESICGRNQNNHFNSDNFITSPGITNAAHHVHEYVGNLSANGLSTDASLDAAGTTCRRSDQSTYYWPALRQRGTVGADQNADGGGNDGNIGRIIRPRAVRLEFRGNDTAKVVNMPRFIRMITGDAKATTNGPANAKAQWTCTGFTNRVTTKYPLCPRGSQVQRILNFPSCWDGTNKDSANHRAHVIFADQAGACPAGTKAVPQLRMTLTYAVPSGRSYSLDSFPEQLHNPLTDHADFANLMPDSLMSTAVDCINRGRRC